MKPLSHIKIWLRSYRFYTTKYHDEREPAVEYETDEITFNLKNLQELVSCYDNQRSIRGTVLGDQLQGGLRKALLGMIFDITYDSHSTTIIHKLLLDEHIISLPSKDNDMFQRYDGSVDFKEDPVIGGGLCLYHDDFDDIEEQVITWKQEVDKMYKEECTKADRQAKPSSTYRPRRGGDYD